MQKNNVQRKLINIYLGNNLDNGDLMNATSDYGDSGYLGYSKAIREAQERMGCMVTFFKNGEQFERGIRVSLIPGKTFKNFDVFCDHLTQRTNVLHGCRYIFTLNGDPISSLDQLQHNQSYVVSGVRQFQFLPYGQQDLLRRPHQILGTIASNNGLKKEDLKLMRPLSPQQKLNIYEKFALERPGVGKFDKSPQPGRDGKIVTVINGEEPELKSRVLLNLRNPGSFEIVLKDLGQAVQMSNPQKMYTSKGKEVRSISQLRHELGTTDSLLIESASSTRKRMAASKSKSLESVHAAKGVRLAKAESQKNIAGAVNGDEAESLLFQRRMAPEAANSTSNSMALNGTNAFDSPESNGPELEARDTNAKLAETTANEATNHSEPEAPLFQTVRRGNVQGAQNVQISPKTMPRHLQPGDEVNSSRNNDQLPQPPSYELATTNHVKEGERRGQVLVKDQPVDASPRMYSNSDFIRSSWEEGISLREDQRTRKEEPSIERIRRQLRRAYGGDDDDDEDETTNGGWLGTNQSSIDEVPEVLEKPIARTDARQTRTHTGTKTMSTAPLATTKLEPKAKKESSEGVVVDAENRSRSNVNLVIANEAAEPKVNEIINERSTHSLIDNMKDGINLPEKNIFLDRVFGYMGDCVGNNLAKANESEMAYYVAGIIVLWNPGTNSQRFYSEHTQDIECLVVHASSNIAASSQKAGSGRSPPFSVQVNIWNCATLETLASLKDTDIGQSILSLSFSKEGFLAMLACTEATARVFIWNWREDQLVCSINHILDKGELVYGGHFHSTEEDIVVTYGQRHLTLWQLYEDKSGVMQQSSLRNAKLKSSINVLAFLQDDTLLTGDTNGNLTIWSPAARTEETTMEYLQIEFGAHQKAISSLQIMKNGTVVSGDTEGNVKTWDINEGVFRLLNAVKLPETSGAICSLCSLDHDDDPSELYIGTSTNQILVGSAMRATNFSLIFEGHALGVRNVAAHPSELSFYSCGLDHRVCKWGDQGLVWKAKMKDKTISIASHPSGQVVAVGTVGGVINILSDQDGTLISQLPVCQSTVGCLAYAPDGDLLAAGSSDGVMYLLPASNDGYSYEKVSVLKGPHSILSLQWSSDGQYVLTSVNDSQYQELILWDLANCRYMRGVASASQSISWIDATCSGGEDVRGIWDNDHLKDVVNLSCHCSPSKALLASGDEAGFLRLFTYPCIDPRSGFFERKTGSGGVTEVKFLYDGDHLITGSMEGLLLRWKLEPIDKAKLAEAGKLHIENGKDGDE